MGDGRRWLKGHPCLSPSCWLKRRSWFSRFGLDRSGGVQSRKKVEGQSRQSPCSPGWENPELPTRPAFGRCHPSPFHLLLVPGIECTSLKREEQGGRRPVSPKNLPLGRQGTEGPAPLFLPFLGEFCLPPAPVTATRERSWPQPRGLHSSRLARYADRCALGGERGRSGRKSLAHCRLGSSSSKSDF